MHFHVITLFPESFTSYIGSSILKRAQKSGAISIDFYNPRDFTDDPRGGVDGKPYGGGPGMVIEALPVVRAVKKAIGRKKNVTVWWFSPSGKEFNSEIARDTAGSSHHVVLICGHYEGIDARAREILGAEEISIGNYILTGGELPALVVMDTIARFVPGVLGNIDSLEDDRAASNDVYTRPEALIYKNKKYQVPEVLLTGHHQNIDKWRAENRKRK
jgi:tRNA (guanine37-N1)-methyltransferase